MSDEATQEVEKKPGIGKVARDAIKAGKSNEEALEAVRAAHPDANTTMASINWYRNDMRRTDKTVPTSSEVKKTAAGASGGANPDTDSAVRKKNKGKKGATPSIDQELPASQVQEDDGF